MSEAVASAGAGVRAPALARFSSDERLTRRAIAGDERAFAAIFRRYQQDLYRYCLAILANPDDAQDALQNTMVKALRALPGESRRIELKPWLYRIAHNESIDLVRRRRAGEPLDPELTAAGPGLAQEAEARERLGKLIADLETLPERQRGVLVMRELSGLDFDEIAGALGTSAATARQTLYEARLSLRQIEAGREMDCDAVTRALSDADGRVTRRRDIRAHLRACPSCRAFGAEIEGRSRDLAALSPLPALVAAGLLQGVLGGGGGTGGGLTGLLGGGAAQAVGTSAAVKATATVAVVAAIGVTAAQRGDLVQIGLPGEGGSKSTQTLRPAAGSGDAANAAGGSAQATEAAAPTAARRAGAPIRQLGDRRALDGNDRAAATNVPASPRSDAAAEAPGHDGTLPSASNHGQQTAAAHRNASQGKAAAPEHPAHPAHPSHPAKPAKPPTAGQTSKPAKPTKATTPKPAAKGSERAAQTPAATAEPPTNGNSPK